jgi:hypothetical protein
LASRVFTLLPFNPTAFSGSADWKLAVIECSGRIANVTASRLAIGDTAGWQPALRALRFVSSFNSRLK